MTDRYDEQIDHMLEGYVIGDVSRIGLKQEIAAALRAAVEEEREQCALLHEQIDISEGVSAMAAVIDYRDGIRARST